MFTTRKFLLLTIAFTLSLGVCSTSVYGQRGHAASKKPAPAEETEEEEGGTVKITGECPLEGDSKGDKVRSLNVLKNRSEFPDDDVFTDSIDLDMVMQRGDDSQRWSTDSAAAIVGYVYDVKPGGLETCNCHNHDIDGRDTHIEIILDPDVNDGTNRMVVEVTPRMRKAMLAQGIDWSTPTLKKTLKGQWVEFEGWLFYDLEHTNAAENTNPGHPHNWRGTAWELHPVTKITVLNNDEDEN